MRSECELLALTADQPVPAVTNRPLPFPAARTFGDMTPEAVGQRRRGPVSIPARPATELAARIGSGVTGLDGHWPTTTMTPSGTRSKGADCPVVSSRGLSWHGLPHTPLMHDRAGARLLPPVIMNTNQPEWHPIRHSIPAHSLIQGVNRAPLGADGDMSVDPRGDRRIGVA